MFSIHPIEVMWAQAPSDIKVNLALSLIVEILEASEGNRIEITLDDGDYEIVMNKLEATADQK